ncbi:MAG: peptide chain release factor N(5)-glutamine methyltransferase [Bacteroidales bacterium]
MQKKQLTIQEILEWLHSQLLHCYEDRERRQIFHLLSEAKLNMPAAQLYIAMDKELTAEQQEWFEQAIVQLKEMRPIQYVLGATAFCGLEFEVNEHTLIPRPETEELVAWAMDLCAARSQCSILDVGTGSGCIAVSLKAQMPNATVQACDISLQALEVAQRNAQKNDADIVFKQMDILHESYSKQDNFDLIVSNPPYVCLHEKAFMHKNVLEHEPHSALFVDDATPLIFYEALAKFAKGHLSPNGYLLVEINAMFGKATMELFRLHNFVNLNLRKDINGKDRMIVAQYGA